MFRSICLELDDEPEYEDRLIYQMVADMFGVDIEFDESEVLITGWPSDVIAWIAFHLLPMEVGEA